MRYFLIITILIFIIIKMKNNIKRNNCNLKDCDVLDNLFVCGSCRQVKYCSKKCQKLDWNQIGNHKEYCKHLTDFRSNKNSDIIKANTLAFAHKNGDFGLKINENKSSTLFESIVDKIDCLS